MRIVTATIVMAAVAAAAPVTAQERKLNLSVGGGYTPSVSDLRDSVNDGFNFNVGLIYNLNDTFGLHAEYSLNGLKQKTITLPVSVTPAADLTPADFFVELKMQYFDVNLMVRPPINTRFAPYLLAGGGVYYRPIIVSSPAVGFVPGYCNPYWFMCFPGETVPVNEIVGRRESTDFGVDVGGGVNYTLSENASLFVEARYHFIWGPEIRNPVTGGSTAANGKFLPITVGLRF